MFDVPLQYGTVCMVRAGMVLLCVCTVCEYPLLHSETNDAIEVFIHNIILSSSASSVVFSNLSISLT